MTTSVPFSPELANELAQRERFLQETRDRRVGSCMEVLRSATPPSVLTQVYVLYPYSSFEGRTRYRKVLEWRDIPV